MGAGRELNLTEKESSMRGGEINEMFRNWKDGPSDSTN